MSTKETEATTGGMDLTAALAEIDRLVDRLRDRPAADEYEDDEYEPSGARPAPEAWPPRTAAEREQEAAAWAESADPSLALHDDHGPQANIVGGAPHHPTLLPDGRDMCLTCDVEFPCEPFAMLAPHSLTTDRQEATDDAAQHPA